MNTVRIGIIGIGNIGTKHLQTILRGETPELSLAAVADRSPARREWAGEELPEGTAIFHEGSELIASGTCDAALPAPGTVHQRL